MEENAILIPMECLYDIPSLNEMSMKSYKKGDIFMYNPYHEVHVTLEEHGVFKEVENDLCDFFCYVPDLNINGHIYNQNEKIADKDIKSMDEDALKSLCYIGYINKRIKTQIDNKNEEDKKQVEDKVESRPKIKKAKKVTAETYATIARNLKIEKDVFKKTLFEQKGIVVKDMRKKVPLKQIKIIQEVFKK